MQNNIWKKFIQCHCGTEGIMISYETEEDGLPVIDLAFFGYGYITNRTLSLWEKLRYCWHILIKGEPFIDEVILSQNNAKELATELMRFVRFPYGWRDKKNEENKRDIK